MPHDQSSAGGSPRRRRASRLPIIAFGFIIIAVGSGAFAWWSLKTSQASQQIAQADKFTVEPRDFVVSLKEKGELKAAGFVEVLCEVEGRSTILELVAEGAQVKKGDLLVRLASNEIEDRIADGEREEARALGDFNDAKLELEIQRDRNTSDIRKGELAIELARLELEKYKEGDWPQQQKDAQINIEQAVITQERRREDFDAAETLHARKFITKAERDEDEFNLKKANWDLEKANRAKEILELYTHRAQKAKLESDLDEATKECDRIRKNAAAEEERKVATLASRERELELSREKLAKLREQKEKTRILSPGEGFVIYGSPQERSMWGNSDEQIKKGATVNEQQVLMTIPDTSSMVVMAKIHESKVNRIRVGQPALVEIEGLPGKQFNAKVSKIARLAASRDRWMNPDLKEYETEITLDSTDEGLKPGQTARAEILIGQAQAALAVPNQAIYSKAGHRYVFRWQAGRIEPAEVQLGKMNNEWAELAAGVSKGDQILLSFSDEHIRLLPDVPPVPQELPNLEGLQNGAGPQGGGGPEGGRRGGGGGRPGGQRGGQGAPSKEAQGAATTEPAAEKPKVVPAETPAATEPVKPAGEVAPAPATVSP